MTKFPEGDSDEDHRLQAVIDIVVESVCACDYVPRMATDRTYQPILWDNVELYLLGSAKGIAIVEDRYRPEFNPNVAMEWGWMRAMGKPVLYLVEAEFSHERADASGFLGQRFHWDSPETDIPAAVRGWLS
jgi:hypothetical protein